MNENPLLSSSSSAQLAAIAGAGSGGCVSNQVCDLRMHNIEDKVESDQKFTDLKFESLKAEIKSDFRTQTKVVSAVVAVISICVSVFAFLLNFIL